MKTFRIYYHYAFLLIFAIQLGCREHYSIETIESGKPHRSQKLDAIGFDGDTWRTTGEEFSGSFGISRIPFDFKTEVYLPISGKDKILVEYTPIEGAGINKNRLIVVGRKHGSGHVKDGLSHQWNDDGSQSIIPYKEGIIHGRQTSYFSNGQKKIERDYKDGLEHGVSRMWSADGEIIYDGRTANGMDVN